MGFDDDDSLRADLRPTERLPCDHRMIRSCVKELAEPPDSQPPPTGDSCDEVAIWKATAVDSAAAGGVMPAR